MCHILKHEDNKASGNLQVAVNEKEGDSNLFKVQ